MGDPIDEAACCWTLQRPSPGLPLDGTLYFERRESRATLDQPLLRCSGSTVGESALQMHTMKKSEDERVKSLTEGTHSHCRSRTVKPRWTVLGGAMTAEKLLETTYENTRSFNVGC